MKVEFCSEYGLKSHVGSAEKFKMEPCSVGCSQ